MAKDWFKRTPRQAPEAPTIEELIVLERFAEAEQQLLARLRGSSQDTHARLRLAEVLVQLGRGAEALEEYLRVVDQYSQDGFQDKAAALLQRAAKLDPTNQSVTFRLARISEARDLEYTRRIAVEALREASRTDSGRFSTAAIELEQIWDRLAKTELVKLLPAEQVKRLLSHVEIQRLPQGHQLARAGEDRAELFLICGGEITASVSQGSRRIMLRTFATGHIVGDSTLFEHQKWGADFEATKPSGALKLTRQGLEGALLGNPDPRRLLDALRQQRNDRELAQAIGKLTAGA